MPDVSSPAGAPSTAYAMRSADELILRDHLAVDRTALANERTLLAFIRTGLNFLLVGLSFIHLIHTPTAIVAGWLCCAGGGAVLLIGAVRFARMHRRIARAGSGGGGER